MVLHTRTDFFSKQFAEKYDRPVWKPDADELRQFCEYHWPGNVRQLAQVIEQSYVLDCIPTLPGSRRLSVSNVAKDGLPYLDLTQLRQTALRQALRITNGHKGKAAKLLGVHANTLTRMIGELESAQDG